LIIKLNCSEFGDYYENSSDCSSLDDSLLNNNNKNQLFDSNSFLKGEEYTFKIKHYNDEEEEIERYLELENLYVNQILDINAWNEYEKFHNFNFYMSSGNLYNNLIWNDWVNHIYFQNSNMNPKVVQNYDIDNQNKLKSSNPIKSLKK